MPPHLYLNFVRLPLFFRILIIALFIIFTFGFLIYIVEPETFTSPFEGIWWAIITVSTVGYGDIVPKTTLGKLLGMLLVLLGAGFVSTYFVTLASTTVKKQTDILEGKVMFKGKDHFVIVGWNERSRVITEKILKSLYHAPVILIDQSLESNPFSDYRVHFIKGRAHIDETLMKANIYEAKKVIITADQNLDELQADMNSILALLAIKGLNPHAICVVEMLTNEQVPNAQRAGADEIIQSNLISASIMMNCLSATRMAEPLVSLLEQFNGSRFVFRSSTSFIGKSFIDTNKLLIEEGSLLFGIKRGVDTIVNPPHPFIIKEEDILLVISKTEDS